MLQLKLSKIVVQNPSDRIAKCFGPNETNRFLCHTGVISYSLTDAALKVAKLLSLLFLIWVYLYKVMQCSAFWKHCWPDLTSICAFRTQRVSSSWPLFIFNACFAFLQPSHSQVTPVPISAPSSLQRTNKQTHYPVLWSFFFSSFFKFLADVTNIALQAFFSSRRGNILI